MSSAAEHDISITTSCNGVDASEVAFAESAGSSDARPAGLHIGSDAGGNRRIEAPKAELPAAVPNNDNAEIALLEGQIDACVKGLVSGLKAELGVAHMEAWRHVRDGTERLLHEQLNSLAKFDHRVRNRQIRDLQQLIRTITLETQVRAYARYVTEKRRSRWTRSQIDSYVAQKSFAELLAEMGCNAPAIQRYLQNRRLRREQIARDMLMEIGLSAAAAGRFLRRERAKSFDDAMRLFDEITAIAINPAQLPLHARAGGEKNGRDKRIAAELDAILQLRHTAREKQLAEGWSAGDISNWLRRCSRAELDTGAAVVAVADLTSSQMPTTSRSELPVAHAARRDRQ